MEERMDMKPQKPGILYEILFCFVLFWWGLGQTIEFCDEVGEVESSERGVRWGG